MITSNKESARYIRCSVVAAPLIFIIALFGSSATYANSQYSKKAIAYFDSCSDHHVSGFATLKERASSEGVKEVEVYLQVNGLDGKRAVHIHETASCQPCGSAGGHFDPGSAGLSNPDANHPFHSGDLINIDNSRGLGILTTRTTRVTLSDGPLSLFDKDGSAFIIHDNIDSYCQGGEVAGCAGGSRAACAIIRPVSSSDDFELHVSTNSWREYPTELANAELSGRAYIFLSPKRPVSSVASVEFFVNGQARRQENYAPFDLGGGSQHESNALSTSHMPDGVHTASAIITLESGERTYVSSEFTVDNNRRRFGNGNESAHTH